MNRLNVPVKLPNSASNITYNSANQMMTFNDKNITYDANGNMETITTIHVGLQRIVGMQRIGLLALMALILIAHR